MDLNLVTCEWEECENKMDSIFDSARNLEGYFKPTHSRKRLRHRVRQGLKVFLKEMDEIMAEANRI